MLIAHALIVDPFYQPSRTVDTIFDTLVVRLHRVAEP